MDHSLCDAHGGWFAVPLIEKEECNNEKIARRSFLKIAGTVATACVVSGLSGCGAKEPLGSQSSTAGASESVTSNEVLEVASESTDSAYPTLTEVMKEYSGCGLSYPNFEELSVGMLYKGEEHKYCLFDKDGKVHHVFDEDTNVVSGFYNGMCLTGGRVMSTEDGTTFRPSYIPAEEVLVSYFKMTAGRFFGLSGRKIPLKVLKRY